MNFFNFFVPFNIPPLLFPAIALILGILCAWSEFSNIFILSASLLIIFLSVAAYFSLKNKHSLLLFSVLFFLYGFYRYISLAKDYETASNAIANSIVKIVGTISHIETENNQRFKHQIEINIESLQTAQGVHIASCQNKTIIVATNSIITCQIGDYISFNAKISSIQRKSIKNYFLKEGVLSYTFAQPFLYTLIERPRFSFKRAVYEKKMALLARARECMTPSTYTFFSLLFLGHKEKTSAHYKWLKKQFQFWGISHYLARSGLHLVIIVTSWRILFSYLPIALLYKVIFTLFCALLYGLLTWTSISFLRAILTLITMQILIFLHHQIHTLHIITLITCITLCYNPFYLFFLDFQLSFGITFLLAWISHVNQRKIAQ